MVHADAADLSTTPSPDGNQNHVWYLTTWQFNHTIYFARAESDGGGTLSFAAGPAKSFDRPGLNAQTIATLADYSGGTTVQGTRSGNDIAITVPPSLVGGPASGAVLESVTAYAALDSGLPPFVGPLTGNMPTLVDATPAYDAVLALPSTSSSSGSNGSNGTTATTGTSGGSPNSGALPAGGGAVAAGAALLLTASLSGRRRRVRARAKPRAG